MLCRAVGYSIGLGCSRPRASKYVLQCTQNEIADAIDTDICIDNIHDLLFFSQRSIHRKLSNSEYGHIKYDKPHIQQNETRAISQVCHVQFTVWMSCYHRIHIPLLTLLCTFNSYSKWKIGLGLATLVIRGAAALKSILHCHSDAIAVFQHCNGHPAMANEHVAKSSTTEVKLPLHHNMSELSAAQRAQSCLGQSWGIFIFFCFWPRLGDTNIECGQAW